MREEEFVFPKLLIRMTGVLALGASHASALETNFSPEQRTALEAAQAEGDNFEWAVLTKTVRGEPRTVVLMGEGFVVLPNDTVVAKRVIDQFERFAVDQTGPYDGRETPQSYPEPGEPMNLTARGARTKSIENVERLHRWGVPDYAEAGLLMGSVLASFFSIGYLQLGTGHVGFSPQRAAVAGGVLATTALFWAAAGLCPTCFPLGKSRAASMAKFIDRWVRADGGAEPLLVVIKKGFVDEVRARLIQKYHFVGSVR